MPNEYGQIVQLVWDELPKHYPNVQLGEFVVMPNRIHGIIAIRDGGVVANGTVGTGLKPAPTPAPTLACTIAAPTIPAAPLPTRHQLSEIVRALISFSAKQINELQNTRGQKLRQRNYYEHIIRNEQSHRRIADYIINNPANWNSDKYYAE